MKKTIFTTLGATGLLLPLSACSAQGKTAGLSIVYGALALLSLLLLFGCILLVRQKRLWFITLFSSVFVINVGYTLLSLSRTLPQALWANRITYLGSVALAPAMLMILLNVTDTPYKKRLPFALIAGGALMFFITASPGLLPIYYKEVSFVLTDGVGTLVKVYGPLHPVYSVYLLGYFAAMIAVIAVAAAKRKIDSVSHAVVIAIAVGVNIGVWFIGQITDLIFEMLSVSYIISELFLLGVHLVARENRRLKELLRQSQEAQLPRPPASPPSGESPSAERMELFLAGLALLTPTEKTIYEHYVHRATTEEVLSALNIKETTLKYHNRNLYSKLGVSSRKELLEFYKHTR